MTLPERFGIGRRYSLHVMTEGKQLASHVVRRHAGFDPDQALRHIGEPSCDPAASELLTQHGRSVPSSEVGLALPDARCGRTMRYVRS